MRPPRKAKPTGAVQDCTAHIVKRAGRYDVYLAEQLLGHAASRTEARALAKRLSTAAELTECWERGKAFERSPRGAWKVVR